MAKHREKLPRLTEDLTYNTVLVDQLGKITSRRGITRNPWIDKGMTMNDVPRHGGQRHAGSLPDDGAAAWKRAYAIYLDEYRRSV